MLKSAEIHVSVLPEVSPLFLKTRHTHLQVSATCKSIRTSTSQDQQSTGVGGGVVDRSESHFNQLHAPYLTYSSYLKILHSLSLPKSTDEWGKQIS